MRILFASIPMDGHFNPLTGLAVHFAERGHDVCWYAAPSYAQKLQALGIAHRVFSRATDVNASNLTQYFPEYEKLGLGPKAISFALEKIFFGNLEAHLHDILELYEDFPFEAVIFDSAFYAGRLVGEKLDIPVYPVWPSPTPAPSSSTAPPPFLGLKPWSGPLGRARDFVVRKMVNGSTEKGMEIWHELRAREGLPRWDGCLFDVHNDSSSALFMAGVPGMDFPRTDWPENFEFVGALLPHQKSKPPALTEHLREKLETHRGSVIVVAQGTVDNRDPEKLFVPALNALAGTKHLVVATTGGRHTAELQRRFPQDNVVVVDFADYTQLMSKASLFISNGGYGSVMHALVYGVPLLLAGKLEAKNDINARMAYRGLGIDLKTERPTARQIGRSVEQILNEESYRSAAQAVRRELQQYNAPSIVERWVVGESIEQAHAEDRQSANLGEGG